MTELTVLVTDDFHLKMKPTLSALTYLRDCLVITERQIRRRMDAESFPRAWFDREMPA